MASQVTRAKKQQSRIIANFDGSYLLKILLNGNSFGADPEFEKWVDDVRLHQVNDVLETGSTFEQLLEVFNLFDYIKVWVTRLER